MIVPDILKRVFATFPIEHIEAVMTILEELSSRQTIVGGEQLARSIVFLSQGDISKLKYYQQLNWDPRDIIGTAEEKAGNYGHYFGLPFDEIIEFEKGLNMSWNDLAKDEEERDKLPPEYYQNIPLDER